MDRPTHRNTRPPSDAGRWFLGMLGLTTATIGLFFVWLMARSYLRAREMHAWPEVPAVILSSEVEERRHDESSPVEFRINLSYGYEWQGTPRFGQLYTLRGSPWTSKPNVIAQRKSDLASGTRTTCRVNPNNPDFAVLKPDSLAPGYSIWFPSLFVIGGLGIVARAITVGRRKPINV